MTYSDTTAKEMLPILERRGLKGRQGLLPVLLARAGKSRRPGLFGREHAQGGRRADPRLPGPGRRHLLPGRGQDGPGLLDPSGRVDQAARKHLPGGQHRPGVCHVGRGTRFRFG